MSTSPRQYRVSPSDILMCTALEAAGARLARRLIAGRRCPECGASLSGRHPVRHLAGAMLLELVLDGIVVEAFARRARPARVDASRASVPEPVTPGHLVRVPVPQQRTAPQPVGAQAGTG